jgi:hypothetical protein
VSMGSMYYAPGVTAVGVSGSIPDSE